MSVAKKTRKVSSGPIREKARTMKKLVAAVGKVIQKQGYPGLTIANIATASGVDRKLVYTYFGSLDHLVETYMKQKDYWISGAKGNLDDMLQDPEAIGEELVLATLQAQFDTLLKDKVLQKIIHWGLGEKSKILKNIANSREEVGAPLLQYAEQKFKGTDIDLRAILALQISGLYYLVLQAKSTGSTFCGIDINKPEGRARIEKALEKLIGLIYAQAGN